MTEFVKNDEGAQSHEGCAYGINQILHCFSLKFSFSERALKHSPGPSDPFQEGARYFSALSVYEHPSFSGSAGGSRETRAVAAKTPERQSHSPHSAPPAWFRPVRG